MNMYIMKIIRNDFFLVMETVTIYILVIKLKIAIIIMGMRMANA